MDKDPFQVSGPLGRKKSVKTGIFQFIMHNTSC